MCIDSEYISWTLLFACIAFVDLSYLNFFVILSDLLFFFNQFCSLSLAASLLLLLLLLIRPSRTCIHDLLTPWLKFSPIVYDPIHWRVLPFLAVVFEVQFLVRYLLHLERCPRKDGWSLPLLNRSNLQYLSIVHFSSQHNWWVLCENVFFLRRSWWYHCYCRHNVCICRFVWFYYPNHRVWVMKCPERTPRVRKDCHHGFTCLIIASRQRWNSTSEISLFETYSSRNTRSLLPCLTENKLPSNPT